MQNLETPLRKDSFQVWQRSWAVLRIHAWAPGVWQFHCHMEQHIPLGMVTALNVLPSQQKPVPSDVPSSGSCPNWWDALNESSAIDRLTDENANLRRKVMRLEEQLRKTKELL